MSWWVVNELQRGGGRLPVSFTQYAVVQSATRPGNALQGAIGGPYATKADAEAYLHQAQNYGNNPVSAAGQAASDAANATGIGAIGHFFAQLGSRETAIRIAEVLIGGFLIVVGINKLTGGKLAELTPAGKAAKLAKVVKK